ncbi:MAG: DMT family transporter [Desulfobacteraceae bacterium]|nr:DMT family transporter [Desulfobacteraceae bacterium]MBC2758038.1 DMT family transporter [Desulfobacteraceae bacterium]
MLNLDGFVIPPGRDCVALHPSSTQRTKSTPHSSRFATPCQWVASITYLIWFWLIRNYPPSRLASFTFLAPLLGVIAGGFLLNEPITNRLIFALFFVGTGIYLVNRPFNGSG